MWLKCRFSASIQYFNSIWAMQALSGKLSLSFFYLGIMKWQVSPAHENACQSIVACPNCINTKKTDDLQTEGPKKNYFVLKCAHEIV